MTEPLDFSSAGGRAAPPPPTPAKRSGGAKKVLLVAAVLAGAAFVAIVVFDVFGDDAKVDSLETSRYCQLAVELERVSRATGASSAPGVYDGGPEKVKAVVDQMGGSLDELRSVAPKPIRKEVGVVTDALERTAAGDANALKDPDFTPTAVRASNHRVASCTISSGVSDGD